jgi:protein-S-isoprenylcysteine O-methyltransferase Ste14
MKKRNHLPFYGVGPMIGFVMVATTVIGIGLSCFGYLDFGKIDFLRVPLTVIGAALVAFGVYLFYGAHYKARLFEQVEKNKLVTTGVYAIVRNPVYSGFLSICTGAVCVAANWVLFVIPVFCWGFMTVVLIFSEEKWLKDLYGTEYVRYCSRTNRCIPWFPKD